MNIREARKQKKMSMKKAAEILEMPYRTLQNYELGTRTIQPYFEKLVVEKILSYQDDKKE